VTFPALAAGYMFCVILEEKCNPRFPRVTFFPQFLWGYNLSRPCHRLHVYPRLLPVTSSSALAASAKNTKKSFIPRKPTLDQSGHPTNETNKFQNKTQNRPTGTKRGKHDASSN